MRMGAIGLGCVGLLAGCARSRTAPVQPDPTPAGDAAVVDAAPPEKIYAAADIAREFAEDYDAAWARWGYHDGADGGSVAHHAPFLVSGKLLGRDVLMSGPDLVRFGDATRGAADCYVPYITPAMNAWPWDKEIVARANAISNFAQGQPSTAAGAASPPTIYVDCEFLELPTGTVIK